MKHSLFGLLASALALSHCRPQPEPASAPAPAISSTAPSNTGEALPQSLPPANTVSQPELLQQAAQASNRLAFDLYGTLRKTPGNLTFSPANIAIALNMTLTGARQETQAQMARVLHVENGVSPEAFPALVQNLQALNGKDGAQLRPANRLWGQAGFHFKPEFLAFLARQYQAPLAQGELADEKTRAEINSWVAQSTAGRIVDLIPAGALTKDSRLVLVSALYFKAQWQKQFEKSKTHDGKFFVDNTSKTASLMNQSGPFAYAHLDGQQIIELPYRGGLSMLVILPDARDGLADLEAKIAERYASWVAALSVNQVDVILPRFKSTSALELSKSLKTLGMPLAFENADFSGMSEQGQLAISAILHQAFVEVGEEGTEAAAATSVVMQVLSLPIAPDLKFHADHPFIYLIREPASGAILFAGRVTDPVRAGK